MKDFQNKNLLIYISISATFAGMCLSVFYIKSNDSLPFEDTQISENIQDSLFKLHEIIKSKEVTINDLRQESNSLKESVQILQNSISYKEEFQKNKLSKVKKKKPKEERNEKIFDQTFVDIACITAKFMLKKSNSDTDNINCDVNLKSFLLNLNEYPTAKKCIEMAKKGSYVYGKKNEKDIENVKNYIKKIKSFLLELDVSKYNIDEITSLERESLNYLNIAKEKANSEL